jgi:hypothetical protein
MLQPLLVFLALLGGRVDCTTIPDTATVVVVGAFSDMRYTEEHGYGHLVELWRAGSCLFGFLEVSEGLAGDTPVGELKEIHSDPRTRRLSFRAKLTVGATKARDADTWVPSRDLFTFTGYLTPQLLKGTLSRSDQLRPEPKPVEQPVVLRLDPDQQATMLEANTYGAWRTAVEPILRFRGPKW